MSVSASVSVSVTVFVVSVPASVSVSVSVSVSLDDAASQRPLHVPMGLRSLHAPKNVASAF